MLSFMRNEKSFISVLPSENLPAAISSVHYNIRSSGKSAGVARKVKIYSLQLFRIPLASHWRETQPFIFPFFRNPGRYRSLDIPR